MMGEKGNEKGCKKGVKNPNLPQICPAVPVPVPNGHCHFLHKWYRTGKSGTATTVPFFFFFFRIVVNLEQ